MQAIAITANKSPLQIRLNKRIFLGLPPAQIARITAQAVPTLLPSRFHHGFAPTIFNAAAPSQLCIVNTIEASSVKATITAQSSSRRHCRKDARSIDNERPPW